MQNIDFKRKGFWPVLVITLVVAVVSGCGSFSTTVVAKNMTQPVMLGPVHNVKSDKAKPIYKKEDFDIRVQDSISTSSTGRYSSQTNVVQEAEEKIDAELLKKLESPADKIVVDKIFVHSSLSCLFIFCSSRTDYSGIEGGIYSVKPPAEGAQK